MASFLNLLRGPQPAFVPEREVRHLSTRSAKLTDRDIRASLRFPDMLPATTYKTAEIKRLEAHISYLEDELQKIEELVSVGKEVVSEHKGTIKSLNKSIKDLTAEKDLAETKAKGFKADLDAARKEKEQLETKRDKLEKDLEASQQHEASLQGEFCKADADWQQRIQELEDTLAATQADNIALKEEIALKDELIAEEQAKYHNAMALLLAEQEKSQSLEARVAYLQELLTAQTTKHAKHTETLKDSRDAHKRGEENERKANTAVQAERDAMRNERDKALARVAELEGLTSDQQMRISSLEESLGVERSRGDELVREMAQLRQQLQKVVDALTKANEELHSALQTKRLLSKDLKAAQKELTAIHAKVVVATSTDEQLQERVVLAEKGNREQQTSQRAVETMLFDFVKRYDAVTSELARLRIASAPSSPVPSNPLPLCNAVPFDIAPQLEADSPPAKRRSFFGFFGKQADDDFKVSSPALA